MSALDFLVFGGLSLLNLFLFVYVLKGLRRLAGPGAKNKLQAQAQLIDTLKNSISASEKETLIKTYNSQYSASDIKILNSKKAAAKIRAMRRLGLLGDTQLFEIKKLVDDKDDSVAVRAFHFLAKNNPGILNLEIIKKTAARAAQHRALLSSALLRISRSSNYQVLIDLAKEEVPHWITINTLKALTRSQVPDLLPLLLNAQEHSSEEVRKAANHILNQNPLFQKFAS